MHKRRTDKTNSESDLEELKRRVSIFCQETGYRLSPDADAILQDIINAKQITGDFYCPCQTRRSSETVCVCRSVRNGLVDLLDSCFCNLIINGNKFKE
jgi:ferredoxin-thioredoxin reductase catalytic subunit